MFGVEYLDSVRVVAALPQWLLSMARSGAVWSHIGHQINQMRSRDTFIVICCRCASIYRDVVAVSEADLFSLFYFIAVVYHSEYRLKYNSLYMVIRQL